jgi:hypothetical protein
MGEQQVDQLADVDCISHLKATEHPASSSHPSSSILQLPSTHPSTRTAKRKKAMGRRKIEIEPIAVSVKSCGGEASRESGAGGVVLVVVTVPGDVLLLLLLLCGKKDTNADDERRTKGTGRSRS